MEEDSDDRTWYDLAQGITGTRRERSFKSHFGGPQIAIKILFSLLHETSALDLLYTLTFLKIYGESMETISSRFKMDSRTLTAKLVKTLTEIDQHLPEVSSFFLNFL